MLKLKEHTETILSVIKNELRQSVKNPDVEIICKDGESVQTHKSLLCLFSPLLRIILSSEKNVETTFSMSMPDFNKSSIQNFIRILSFNWKEEDAWNSEVIDVFDALEIYVGEFEIKTFFPMKKESGSFIDNKSTLKQNRQSNDEEKSQMEQHNEQHMPSVVNQSYSRVQEVKCPNCPRKFSGSVSRLMDMLKCHIGHIHFKNELMSEIKTYFPNSTKECNVCKKIFNGINGISTMRKHLVFNHSKYVEIIKSLAVKAIKENSQCDLPTKGSKDEPAKLNKEGDKENSGKGITSYQSISSYNEHNTEEESFMEVDDGSLVHTTADSRILKCNLDCAKTWESEKVKKQFIVNHIISHFNIQLSKHHSDYFKGKKCVKCPSSPSNFTNFSSKDKHLFFKHNILKDDINNCLDSIYKQCSSLNAKKIGESSTSELESLETSKDTNDKDARRDNDDIDSLLKSDDEEPDEFQNIQNILLDNGLSDSDDEDDNIEDLPLDEKTGNNTHDEINATVDSEQEIQSRLLFDQDLSDSDYEDDKNMTKEIDETNDTASSEQDIQNQLLEDQDLTDSDSEDDAANMPEKESQDEDPNSPEQDIQNQLLEDQDLSDSEEEEEPNQAAVDSMEENVGSRVQHNNDSEQVGNADTEQEIQKQLLGDQDLSDSDEETQENMDDDEEIDNVSYDDEETIEHTNKQKEDDVELDEDANLIQLNLIQDQDISDSDSDSADEDEDD